VYSTVLASTQVIGRLHGVMVAVFFVIGQLSCYTITACDRQMDGRTDMPSALQCWRAINVLFVIR